MSTQLQSLELWRHTLLASVRSDVPDLSARQMALLFCVFLEKGPHTVRGLAKKLNISKPAVSRALDRLGELGYIRRERDDLDRRNVLVQRMPKGASFLTDYADLIAKSFNEIASIPEDHVPEFVVDFAGANLDVDGQDASEQPVSSNWVDAAA